MNQTKRVQKRPSYLNDYDYLLANENDMSIFALFSFEIFNFDKAKSNVWVKAMDGEMIMIEKNKTWELVDCPKDKDVIGLKWIYKTKLDQNGKIHKHKARLVVKGYA